MDYNYLKLEDIETGMFLSLIRFEGDIRRCKVIEKKDDMSDKYIVVIDDESNKYKIGNDRLRFICYLSEKDAVKYIRFLDNLSQINF